MRFQRTFLELPALAFAALAGTLACSSNTAATQGGDAGPRDATVPPKDAGSDATDEYVNVPFDAAGPPAVKRVPVLSKTLSKRVYVKDLMFASGEMQTSGEPFASL